MNKYIERIINKYPNYDFSKFEYTRYDCKSTVICNKHGEFEMLYSDICRSGSKYLCKQCKKENKIHNKTPEQRIDDLKFKFPNMIYDKSVYTGYKDDIIITCPEHGDMIEKYNKLLLNHTCGCKICRETSTSVKKRHINNKLNAKKVLSEKFPNLDFSKFEYKTRLDKGIVICPEHGEFEIKYCTLMFKRTKYACPYCAKNKVKDPMKFLIDKFPNLDFSEFEYVNYTTFSKYRCKIHGLELTNTYGRLKDKRNTYGCPKCKTIGKSRPEEFISNKIKEYYEKEIDVNNINTIRNERTNRFMELDIYLPDIKLAIEYNGKYFHTDEMIRARSEGRFNTAKEYHDFKIKMCEKENIHLIHIDENDWLKDSNKILKELEKEIKSRA